MLTSTQQFGAQNYIDQLVSVHKFLTKQDDLSPRNPKVNGVLYGFVRNTMKKRSPEEVAAILNTPLIQRLAPSLRRLLGRAEYEMECFCASAMIGTKPGPKAAFLPMATSSIGAIMRPWLLPNYRP